MKVNVIEKNQDSSYSVTYTTGFPFYKTDHRYTIKVKTSSCTDEFYWRDTGEVVLNTECKKQLEWMDQNDIDYLNNSSFSQLRDTLKNMAEGENNE